MAGLLRLFSSSGACLNRNRVLCRAFSTTFPTQQPPITHEEAEEWVNWESLKSGLKESCLKGAESWENWESFKSWRLEYNKNYPTEEETLYRYKVFCEAKKEVEMLNNNKEEDTGCKYALNFFADISTVDLPLAYRVETIRFRMPRSTRLNYNTHEELI